MMMHHSTDTFRDRLQAGVLLSGALQEFRATNTVLLGLARGGVVVGYSVARELGLPLQALVVRKLGAPRNPELAIGAVSEVGEWWLDHDLVQATGASDDYLAEAIARQTAETQRRRAEYGRTIDLSAVGAWSAIVVDDGIATGATALVGVRSARRLGAERVTLATPVASPHAVQTLQPLVDRLVTLAAPADFRAVGLYYQRFAQVTDAGVVHYLRSAADLSLPPPE